MLERPRAFGQRLVASDLRADRSSKAARRKPGRLGDATLLVRPDQLQTSPKVLIKAGRRRRRNSRNFVPKRDFIRYCEWNTQFFVKRDHGPPADGAASFHTTHWAIVNKPAQGEQSVLAELRRLYRYSLYIAFEGRLGP
jgi:hypothetical protein